MLGVRYGWDQPDNACRIERRTKFPKFPGPENWSRLRKSPKFPQIPLSCKDQGLNLAAALTIWLGQLGEFGEFWGNC
jgi:hypothetical protein